MVDMFGTDVKEGEQIIYCSGAQGSTTLRHGIIQDIYNNNARVRPINGKATSRRGSSGIIKLSPYMKEYPEQFI